jgi:hypothetical protein
MADNENVLGTGELDKNNRPVASENLKKYAREFITSEIKAGGRDGLAPDVISNIKYDEYTKNRALGANVDANRAFEQSNTEKFGNFLMRGIVGEVVGGGIEGIGYGLGLMDISNYYGEREGQKFGNFLVDLGAGIKENINEEFEIFEYNPGKFDLSDPGFWAANGTSIFSTFSLFIPGMLGAKIAGNVGRLAMKGLTVANRTKNILKGAKQSTGVFSKSFDKFNKALGSDKVNLWRDSFAGAASSRHSESALEAAGVFEEVKSAYLNAIDKETGKPYTEAQALEKAGEAAAFSYNANWGAFLSDLPQYMTMLRGPVKVAKGLKAASKVLDLGVTVGGEGVEEFYQHVVQEEAVRHGLKSGGLLENEGATTRFERLGIYAGTDEAKSAAFFGAFGGAAHVGGAKAANKIFKNDTGQDASEALQNAAEIGKMALKEIGGLKAWNTLISHAAMRSDYDNFSAIGAMMMYGISIDAIKNGETEEALKKIDSIAEDFIGYGEDEAEVRSNAEDMKADVINIAKNYKNFNSSDIDGENREDIIDSIVFAKSYHDKLTQNLKNYAAEREEMAANYADEDMTGTQTEARDIKENIKAVEDSIVLLERELKEADLSEGHQKRKTTEVKDLTKKVEELNKKLTGVTEVEGSDVTDENSAVRVDIVDILKKEELAKVAQKEQLSLINTLKDPKARKKADAEITTNKIKAEERQQKEAEEAANTEDEVERTKEETTVEEEVSNVPSNGTIDWGNRDSVRSASNQLMTMYEGGAKTKEVAPGMQSPAFYPQLKKDLTELFGKIGKALKIPEGDIRERLKDILGPIADPNVGVPAITNKETGEVELRAFLSNGDPSATAYALDIIMRFTPEQVGEAKRKKFIKNGTKFTEGDIANYKRDFGVIQDEIKKFYHEKLGLKDVSESVAELKEDVVVIEEEKNEKEEDPVTDTNESLEKKLDKAFRKATYLVSALIEPLTGRDALRKYWDIDYLNNPYGLTIGSKIKLVVADENVNDEMKGFWSAWKSRMNANFLPIHILAEDSDGKWHRVGQVPSTTVKALNKAFTTDEAKSLNDKGIGPDAIKALREFFWENQGAELETTVSAMTLGMPINNGKEQSTIRNIKYASKDGSIVLGGFSQAHGYSVPENATIKKGLSRYDREDFEDHSKQGFTYAIGVASNGRPYPIMLRTKPLKEVEGAVDAVMELLEEAAKDISKIPSVKKRIQEIINVDNVKEKENQKFQFNFGIRKGNSYLTFGVNNKGKLNTVSLDSLKEVEGNLREFLGNKKLNVNEKSKSTASKRTINSKGEFVSPIDGTSHKSYNDYLADVVLDTNFSGQFRNTVFSFKMPSSISVKKSAAATTTTTTPTQEEDLDNIIVGDEEFSTKDPAAIVKMLKEHKQFIKGKTKDGKLVEVDSGEEYVVYHNTKTGKDYERVTTFLSEEEAEGPLLEAASIIGRKLDKYIRDFLIGNLRDPGSYGLGEALSDGDFLPKLKALKDGFEARGETIVSDEIILFNDDLGIAGTTDIITYDEKGIFRIYDIKTMRGNNFTQHYKGQKQNKYDTDAYGKSKRQKHQEQLSVYRILLENTYGLIVKEIKVIPIAIAYEAKDTQPSSIELIQDDKGNDFVELTPLDKVKYAEIGKSDSGGQTLEEVLGEVPDLETSTNVERPFEGEDDFSGMKRPSPNNTGSTRDRLIPVDKVTNLGNPFPPYDRWNETQELKWFKEKFPNVNIEVVRGIIRATDHGRESWGQFTNAMVYIQKNAEAGTTYHEAFHVVYHMFLDGKQRDRIFMEAQAEMGFNGDAAGMKEAEEWMAEKFRNHMMGEKYESPKVKKSWIRQFFDNLMDLLGIERKNYSIQEVFERIDKKKFTTPVQHASKFSNITRNKIVNNFSMEEQNNRVSLIMNMTWSAISWEIDRGNWKDYLDADLNVVARMVKSLLMYEITKGRMKGHSPEQKASVEKMINNFPALWEISMRKFNAMGLRTVNEDLFNLDAAKDIQDSSATNDQNTIHEKAHFEIDPKRNVSFNIKRYIALLSTPHAAPDDLGYSKLVNFHETYSYLAINLAGSTSLENMIDKLENLAKYRPELQAIVADLTGNEVSDEFKNDFYTTFAKQFAKFLAAKYNSRGALSTFSPNRKGLFMDIIQEWKQNFIREGKYTVNVKGETKPNVEKLKVVLAEVKTFIKKLSSQLEDISYEDLQRAKGYYAVLGINMSEQTLMDISNDGKADVLAEEMADADNLVGLLEKSVRGRYIYSTDKDESQGSVLTGLAKLESYTQVDRYTASFTNGENNKVYSITDMSYLSKLFTKFKTDPSGAVNDLFKNKMNKISKNNSNYVLQQLNDSEDFREKFDWFIFDTFTPNGKEATPYSKLNKEEMDIARLELFLDNGNDNFGYFFLPTPADKSNTIVVKSKKISGNPVDVENILIDRAKREYVRIREAQAYIEKGKNLIKNAHTGPKNALKFVSNPWMTDLLWSGNKLKIIGTIEQKAANPNSVVTTDEIRSAARTYIDRESEKQLSRWLEEGLFKRGIFKRKDGKVERVHFMDTEQMGIYAASAYQSYEGVGTHVTRDKVPVDLTAMARDYTSNYIVYNNDLTAALAGDVAYYSNPSGLSKRFYQAQSVGKQFRVGEGGLEKEFRALAIKDIPVNTALYPEDMWDGPVPVLGDAQGYTTFKYYKALRQASGRWGEREIAAEADLLSGKPADHSLAVFLEPFKTFTYSKRFIEGIGWVPIQIKHSTIPLIPHFIDNAKDKTLSKLNKFMLEHEIDEVNFESGVKYGITPAIDVNEWLDKKEVTADEKEAHFTMINNADRTIVQEVPHKNYGTDAEVDIENVEEEELVNMDGASYEKVGSSNLNTKRGKPKKIRDKVIHGIQHKRLITALVEDEKLIDEYNELIYRNLEESFNKVGSILADPERLQQIVMSQFADRGLPDNNEKLLEIGPNGKFKVPLSFPSIAKKIDYILNAIFKNNVTAQKIYGYTGVQFSSFGLSPDLKMMHKSEDGKTVYPAQVAVSASMFKPGTKLSDLTDDEKKGYVYRIPTQGKNSMLPFVITELIPEYMGNTIHFPVDITAQMGSDFDIDKVNIVMKKKGAKPDTINGRNNRIVDIVYSILTDPKHFDEVTTPVHNDDVKKFISKYFPGIGKDNWKDTPWDSPTTQTDFFAENTAANALIGIFAKQLTHQAVAERTPVNLRAQAAKTIYEVEEDGEGLVVKTNLEAVPGEPRKGKIGGSPLTNLGVGDKVFDRLSQLLNIALDNANSPIAGKINITLETADLLSAMIRQGVAIEDALLFLNNPITKQYSKLKTKLGRRKALKELIKSNNLHSQMKDLKLKGGDIDISKQELINGITDLETSGFVRSAKIVLAITELSQDGEVLANIVNSMDFDSSSHSGGLLLEKLAYMEQYEYNPTVRKMIQNYKQLFGAYLFGVAKAFDLLSEHLPWGKKAFLNAHEHLGLDNSKDGLKAKEMVNYHLMSYIMADVGSPIASIFTKEHRDSLMRGDEANASVAREMSEMLATTEEPMIRNFLNKFDIQLAENPEDEGMDRITFNNDANWSADQKSELTDAFLRLFMDEETRPFARRLAEYSLTTQGFTANRSGFSDMIPAEYYLTPSYSVTGELSGAEPSVAEYWHNALTRLDSADYASETFVQDLIKNNFANEKIEIVKSGFSGEYSKTIIANANEKETARLAAKKQKSETPDLETLTGLEVEKEGAVSETPEVYEVKLSSKENPAVKVQLITSMRLGIFPEDAEITSYGELFFKHYNFDLDKFYLYRVVGVDAETGELVAYLWDTRGTGGTGVGEIEYLRQGEESNRPRNNVSKFLSNLKKDGEPVTTRHELKDTISDNFLQGNKPAKGLLFDPKQRKKDDEALLEKKKGQKFAKKGQEQAEDYAEYARTQSPIDRHDKFQLEEDSYEEREEALDNKMKEFLQGFGISVVAVDKLKTRLGGDAVAVANIIKKMVKIANGRGDISTLPEEAAHFFVEILGDSHPLVQRMMAIVETTQVYADVKEKYGKIYGNDIKALKKEAVGKLIAEAIVKKFKISEEKGVLAVIRNIIRRIISLFKRISGNRLENELEPFAKAARMMLNQTSIENNRLAFSDHLEFWSTEEKDDEKEKKNKLINILLDRRGKYTKAQKTKATVDHAIDVLTKKIAIFGTKTGKEEQVSKLQDLKDDLETKAGEEALLSFYENSQKLVSDAMERARKINSGEIINTALAAKELRNIYQFVSAYDFIDDVLAAARLDKLDKVANEFILPLKQDKDAIKEIYMVKAADLIGKFLHEFTTNPAMTPDAITAELNLSSKDIGWTTRWVRSLAQAPDNVLQIFDIAVRTKKDEGRQKARAIRERLNDVLDAMKAEGVDFNQKGETIYDKYLEKDKDGNNTGYLISEFSHAYFAARKAAHAEWIKGDKLAEKGDEKGEAYHKNRSKKMYAELDNSSKWKNPAYNAIKNDKFYKFYTNTMREAMGKLPPNKRSLYDENHDRFRLPAMRKQWFQRYKEQGRKAVAKDFNDAMIANDHETQYGIFDETGKALNEIPVHFNGKIDPKDQSYDLASMLQTYVNMTENYHALGSILDEIEMTKDLFANRKVQDVDSSGNVIIDKLAGRTGTTKTKDGLESNLYARLNDFIAAQVYGQQKDIDQGYFEIMGKKINKQAISDKFLQYNAINLLATNLLQMVANPIIGGVLQTVESIGGEFYSPKDYAYATKVYASEMGSLGADIPRLRKLSKINVVNDVFNVIQHYSSFEAGTKEVASRFGRAFNNQNLFIGQNAGEHWIQSRLGIAMMNNHTLRDGKIVKKKEGETSLWEQIEVKGGKAFINGKNVSSMGLEREITKFQLKVIGVNQRLHGQYTDADRSAAHRKIVGQWALQFRNWMVPGIDRRFMKQRYDERLQQNIEGNYRTAAKFTNSILKDLRRMQFNFGAHWQKLTPHEKANMYRTLAEIGYMVGTVILIMALEAIGADDDDAGFSMNFLAYQANRLFSELAFYSNPQELFRLTDSPAAGVSQVNKMYNLVGTLMPWNITDKYESGSRKGQFKIRKHAAELTPLWRDIEKVQHIDQILQFFK